MTVKNTRSFLNWIGFFFLVMIFGAAGCASFPFPEKPYSSPAVSENQNPFVRITGSTENSGGSENIEPADLRKDSIKETDLSDKKSSFAPKHLASQPPPPNLIWGKTTRNPESDSIPQHIELAFDNSELNEVLDQTLYKIFDVSYMLDPAIKTTVSLHIAGDYTRDQFINALNQALQLNNLSIVRGYGSIYSIVPSTSSAAAGSGPVSTTNVPGLSGDVTRIIRLRYLSAEAAAANITPFLTKGAPVIQDTLNNALLITDTADNVSKAASVLGLMDIEYYSDVSWQIFPLKEVDLATLVSDATLVEKAKGLVNRKGVLEGSYQIFPIKSMNAVLVVTRWPSVLKLVQEIIESLDHLPETENNIHVYFVQNASALELSDTLQELFVTQTTKGTTQNTSIGSGTSTAGKTSSLQSTPAQPASSKSGTAGKSSIAPKNEIKSLFSEPVELIPDEANNAIVFKANSRDYQKILSILKQLDIQPRQVLINVLVAEITLNGSTSYGIEWFLNKNIGSLGGSSGDYTAQGALDNGTSRAINTPLGTSNGFFFTVYDPTNFMRGLISLLGSDSDVNILSSPNILALDNTPAVIEVGTDVPTITGSTTSADTGTTVTNTVQYRKTGILLTVIPQINSRGLVKMELDQEVSDTGAFNATLKNYNFLTRRAETSVVVQDNQTIVMAGLMKTNTSKSQSGIPYLKDLPVLGYLFGGVSNSKSKTELIFMITPHVIKNRTQADQITREFSQKVQELMGLHKEQP